MTESCKTCEYCKEPTHNDYVCPIHGINVSVKVWSESKPIGCHEWAGKSADHPDE